MAALLKARAIIGAAQGASQRDGHVRYIRSHHYYYYYYIVLVSVLLNVTDLASLSELEQLAISATTPQTFPWMQRFQIHAKFVSPAIRWNGACNVTFLCAFFVCIPVRTAQKSCMSCDAFWIITMLKILELFYNVIQGINSYRIPFDYTLVKIGKCRLMDISAAGD